MSPEHENHLKRLKTQILTLIDGKYRAGQKEHGGNLWLKSGLLDEAINEVIDLAVYLLTMKEQIDGLVGKLEEPVDNSTRQKS